MKLLRLFFLPCLAILFAAVAVAFQIEAPPFDLAASAFVQIALSVGVISAAVAVALRHLTLSSGATGRAVLMRLLFPAPQTGTPPASSFA